MKKLIKDRIKRSIREQAGQVCIDFRSDIWGIIWEIVDEIADSIPNHNLIKNQMIEDIKIINLRRSRD